MEVQKSYKVAKSTVNAQLYGGIGVAIFLLVAILTLRQMPAYPLGFVLVVIGVGIWNSSRSAVTCFNDYMEVKLAPISSLHLIRYRDIVRLDQSNKKYLAIDYLADGKEKTLKLPWPFIEKGAKNSLIAFLQEQQVT